MWDSLAIAEYLHEHHSGVWPSDPKARAYARSAAAEMHSGFGTLRDICSMNCGIRVQLHAVSDALRKDIERLDALGPWASSASAARSWRGAHFTAADAFFCPVAFRVQTYGLVLPTAAAGYVKRLLALPGMKAWYEAALKEKWRDLPHEAEVPRSGKLVHDHRASPSPGTLTPA